MKNIPFLRFIITLLLRGNKPEFIYEKLNDFGYKATIPEIENIFSMLRSTASENILQFLNQGEAIDLSNDTFVGYAKQLGVYEYLDYINYKKKHKSGSNDNKEDNNKPEYIKWFDDIHWLHKYKDTMSLVNIFMFNDQPLDEISSVIQFKYRKKISIEALKMYRQIFWDTCSATAKDAIERCLAFHNNSVIIKTLSSGEQDISFYNNEHRNDGTERDVTFHSIDYIKWKIGYNKFTPPTTKDFLEHVKTDSYFKYYESLNMLESADVTMEDEDNAEYGHSEKVVKHFKNVEEQKAKLAKHWLDMYIKAQKSMPEEKNDEEGFFDKLDQYELKFDDEKIAKAEDVNGLLDDINEDRK